MLLLMPIYHDYIYGFHLFKIIFLVQNGLTTNQISKTKKLEEKASC